MSATCHPFGQQLLLYSPPYVALQRNADRAPSTTSTSLPTELAANPLGGELFERKSRQAVDLRFGKKLAAK